MLLTIPVTGWITTNCYLYTDDRTGHGFLIDPGAEPGVILGKVKETGATVEKILITHGHFDHIGAAREVSDALGAPLVMRESPVHCAESAYWNLSFSTGRPFGLEGIRYVADGSRVALEANPEFFLDVIPAPGHTPDGTVFYSAAAKLAFCGDTIFKEGLGRTDFPGSSERELTDTVALRILSLPDDTVLLPGHFESTTVGNERKLYA